MQFGISVAVVSGVTYTYVPSISYCTTGSVVKYADDTYPSVPSSNLTLYQVCPNVEYCILSITVTLVPGFSICFTFVLTVEAGPFFSAHITSMVLSSFTVSTVGISTKYSLEA